MIIKHLHNFVNFKFIPSFNAWEEIFHIVNCQTTSVNPVKRDKHLVLSHCILIVAERSHRSF